MLKGIASVISPELMKVLMEMGHGDEIVLADGNFPAAAIAKRLIRADGHLLTTMLDAVMPLFPLDKSVQRPVVVMSLQSGDPTPVVWTQYSSTIRKFESAFSDFEYVERFRFYDRARLAYAVVATGDQAFKGNLILKKGVIRDE
ncbi:RbsD/FucU family protein [Paenibacillus xerothermodurans]|uniref:Fucose isomerase n=1 Tax=Paenibacillus xerothermodurans TaxID=1977292 RepID=A0A2W1NGU2_PAEXE|nr:RbsD/FucU domain-containing protein [Paenibacillus xerothermodurans]PZE22321.1 fucose isomerase [Paenibacillus xerothermodurans]